MRNFIRSLLLSLPPFVWDYLVRLCYQHAPERWIWVTKRLFRANNPRLLEAALKMIGEVYWPLVFWTFATHYEPAGGLAKFPKSKGLEDALYRHALHQASTPGPIRDALESWQTRGRQAAETLMGREAQMKLQRAANRVLRNDARLSQANDIQDVVAEMLLLFSQSLEHPEIPFPHQDSLRPDEVSDTPQMVITYLSRMLPRKYGTNTQMARHTRELDETADAQATHSEWVDLVTDDPGEPLEQLIELHSQLSPKQREALEVALKAQQEHTSLEEMSRRLGRNPARDRENFKAIQRRFKSN